MKRIHSIKAPGGFTLTETVVAIGIVGILLTIFISFLIPAKQMVKSALTRQESDRIENALRTELSRLHPNEQATKGTQKSSGSQFISAFDKAYRWMQHTAKPSSTIVLYTYRADLSKKPRKDGSYPPMVAAKSVPGQNSVITAAACLMDDPVRKNDFKHAIGPVFAVRMTQLLPQADGSFKIAKEPGAVYSPKGKKISDPALYFGNEDSDNQWGGCVMYRADFFLMNPPNPERYKKRTWAKMGQPVFSRNLSFRR